MISLLSVTLVLGVAPANAVAAPPAARPEAGVRPPADRALSVPGRSVPARAVPVDPAARAVSDRPVVVSWPAAGAARVEVPAAAPTGRAGDRGSAPPRARADQLPVWVGAPATGAAPGEVRVEVLDQSAARRSGIPGMLLRLNRADGVPTSSRITLELDYAGFGAAAGGSFGARLRLVRLAGCDRAGQPCTGPATPVPARNNVTAARLVAEVDVPGAEASDGGTYAVFAAEAGSTGSFAATSLSPSATWQAGLQSGDFRWSYPIQTPSVPGPKPELSIDYSAASVDGRAGSSNNQPSWVGEGFDLSTGYIERSYRPCKSDTGGSVSSSDLCWVSDNATASFDGMGGTLVRDDATGTWRAQHDSGWKVEKLLGAANGDDNGEYWRLTSPDGTQYYFGLNRPTGWASGRAETNSTWTVPVFGNHSGEPCFNSSATAAWCQQAYRWNLDYVVDRHGDVMSYWYQKDVNNYGRWNGSPYFGQTTPYVRGGYLTRIDYGQRDGAVYGTTPGARVEFTTADRCRNAGATCTSASANWSNWPDVPYDQQCLSSCTYYWAPTFWTTKRLAKVTTQALVGGALSPVDSWTLRQSYPDPYPSTEPWGEENDASRSLWLNGITRSGLVGGALALPEVTFSGLSMKNRHNGNEDFPSLYKWRIGAINTESGGRIEVSYSTAECGGEPYIIPDQTVSRCYPNGRLPSPYGGPDVFYKYVVTQVAEVDLVGGGPTKLSQYEYVGGAAWHYDDSDTTPTAERSWNQWRGYEKVRTRTGNPAAGTQTLTESLFLRGMDNDRLSGGTRRDVWVTDSLGGRVEDHPRLGGFTRETVVYNGSGGPLVNATINDPYLTAPLGSRARTGLDPVQAYQLDIAKIRKRVALATGGVRATEQQRSFDAQGRLWQLDDLGDVVTATDDTCTRTTFAASSTRYLTALPARQEKVSTACGTPPAYPGDLVSDERMYYDGSGTPGAVPGVGEVTRHEKTASWGSGGQVYATNVRAAYDVHGRVTEAFDSNSNRTVTSYTPATGGPVTQTVRTDPLGHAEKASFDPARAQPVEQVDAAGRQTSLAYDPLGRLACVWEPGRPRSSCDSATVRYGYEVRNNGPSVVTTSKLLANGGYETSYSLLDGLLRERQSQSPSPSGGRIVTDTGYDSYGRVLKQNSAYHNTTAPSGALLSVADSAVPAQTTFLYDGAGRQTAEIFRSLGVEKWRTTTTYGGDTVAVDPPDGETASMQLLDIDGRVVELRQYTGGAPTGTYDATRYTYTEAGQLATVTDPAGSVWRYFYDLRGRKIRTEDPDAGTISYAFDDDDRLISTTDGRGRTVSYTYDGAGRKTGAYEGPASTGTKLAGWTYDTAAGGVGMPATATRYVDGNPYTVEVLGYDNGGRPIGSAVTIPAAEVGLAGRYQNKLTYNQAGQVETVRMPFVEGQPTLGGLADETLTYGYTGLGLSRTLSGAASYVSDTTYTALAEPEQYTFGAAGAQVTQTLTYDTATRRLTRAQTNRQTASLPSVADRNYSYDPAGNLLSVSDTPAGGASDTQCFRYDHQRRLTEAWTPAAGCGAGPSTAGLGGPAPYWLSYGYDKIGNRLSEVRHAAGGDSTLTYGYPAAGAAQPHTMRTATTTGPDGARTDSYGYDASGNTTSRPGQSLDWDAEGHLSSVRASVDSTSFVYDADGNRLIRRDPTGATLYLDGMELRLTKSTGALAGTRFYQYGGNMIASRTAAGLAWLVADQHGTAEAAIDAATLAVTVRRHLPFGGTRGAEAGGWPNERGFVGGGKDPSVGLTHLGAREYDPATGRFLSVDPVSDVNDPQQLQGYAYAENNPTSFSDPDGRKTKKQQQKEKLAELQKLVKNTFRDPDYVQEALLKLVDLLKKDPNSPEVRKQLSVIASVLNAEVLDISKELGASSLTAAQKKSLLARIDSLTGFITQLGELVQNILGKKFQNWRAAQNAKVTIAARGEAGLAGATCERASGGIWVCGGAKWTFKGRSYTHGNIFLTRTPTKDALKNKLVLLHETRHATQWALFGEVWFAILYTNMDALSRQATKVFGPRRQAGRTCADAGACYNPLEMDAGLFNGGYFT